MPCGSTGERQHKILFEEGRHILSAAVYVTPTLQDRTVVETRRVSQGLREGNQDVVVHLHPTLTRRA